MDGETNATRAELRGQITHLEQQGATDRHSISELKDQATVDSALIEHLKADGVVDRKEIEGLRTALATCRRIGVAIGVVMVRRQVSEPEAFGILRTASQDTQRKLREIADDVIRTADLQEGARSQQ